jgi:hypothetical protein
MSWTGVCERLLLGISTPILLDDATVEGQPNTVQY